MFLLVIQVDHLWLNSDFGDGMGTKNTNKFCI
jgi:hypothetical protein